MACVAGRDIQVLLLRLNPRMKNCSTPSRFIRARVSRNLTIWPQSMLTLIVRPIRRLFTASKCRALAMSCTIWAGMRARPVMMIVRCRAAICWCRGCALTISISLTLKQTPLRQACSRPLTGPRSKPKPIYPARIRCTVWVLKLSSPFWVTRWAKRRAAICT